MPSKTELFRLKSELKSLEKHLNIALSIMRNLEEEEKKAFEGIPGIVGVFDGENMVTESGEKYLVPPNYAAKSFLLFGDKLKMVEEDGKPFFKNIEKSESKEIRGILSKKEDVWYLLADCGSYRISDTAADFHGAQQNIEATALIPANSVNVPFASLRSVKGEYDDKKSDSGDKKKPESNPAQPKPAPVKNERKPKKQKNEPDKKPMQEKKPEPEKKELPNTEQLVSLNLEDDDLR